MLLAVDFASRHSAAALLGDKGEFVAGCTVDCGPIKDPLSDRFEKLEWFSDQCTEMVLKNNATEIVLEDMHVHAMDPKPGMRLQGAFLILVHQWWGQPVRLIGASTWQSKMGYRRPKPVVANASKKWANALALELGFEAPEWANAKQTSDLSDAFLIGRYAQAN